jgi:hypothetical protein
MEKSNFEINGIPDGKGISVRPDPKKLMRVLHWGGWSNFKYGSIWWRTTCLISW